MSSSCNSRLSIPDFVNRTTHRFERALERADDSCRDGRVSPCEARELPNEFQRDYRMLSHGRTEGIDCLVSKFESRLEQSARSADRRGGDCRPGSRDGRLNAREVNTFLAPEFRDSARTELRNERYNPFDPEDRRRRDEYRSFDRDCGRNDVVDWDY